jgi:hypothetical protein
MLHAYVNLSTCFQHPIQIYCIREGVASASIAAIEWYNGSRGMLSTNTKSLAICYENGAMQLMIREVDPSPIILEIDLFVVSVKWNDNGSILAVAGHQTVADKRHNFIYLYSPWGEVRDEFIMNNTMKIIYHVFILASTCIENHWQDYRWLCMGSSFSSTCHWYR